MFPPKAHTGFEPVSPESALPEPLRRKEAGEVIAARFGAHLVANAGRLGFGHVLGFGLRDRSGQVNRKVYAKGQHGSLPRWLLRERSDLGEAQLAGIGAERPLGSRAAWHGYRRS